MSDITVLSREQIIEVNPATGSVAVVSAGPVGAGLPGLAGAPGEPLDWIGTWTNGVAYLENDAVFYNGSAWVCKLGHTASATNAPQGTTGGTYWDVMARGFNWRNNFSGATAYKAGDVVLSNGSAWYSLTDHAASATIPYSDTTNWARLTQGMNWRGAWATATAYYLYDVVTYNNSTWMVIGNHTSSAVNIPPAQPTMYSILARGTNWRGVWASGTVYYVGDAVSYNGSSYRAVVDVLTAPATTTDPATSGTGVWAVVASKGDPGTNGTNGTNGVNTILAYNEYRPGTNTVIPPSGYAANTWYDTGVSCTFTTGATTTKVKVTLSIYTNANSGTTVTATVLWGLRTAANALVTNSDHRVAGAASGTAAYAGKITSVFVLDVTASTTYTWKWSVQINTVATWNMTAGLQFPATMTVEALN